MKYASITLLLIVAVVLSGCFAGQRPYFDYGPTGVEIQVKRTARYPQRDLKIRYRRTAYVHNIRENVRANSIKQQEILEKYGQPDYVRLPYKSVRGDRVHEWAYLEENKLFQFVKQVLVYEGELSDKDRVLIQRGYPDKALRQEDFLGNRRETFIYENEFDTDRQYYSFTDDNMILGKLAY
jgi:hypothetical protein